MSVGNPNSGGGFVAEYQVAPAPWVTQSSIPAGGADVVVGYNFDPIARHVRFLNHDSGSMKLGFSRNGINGSNYLLVPTSASVDLSCRFTSLFIKGTTGQNYSLFVGQTGIPQKNHAVVTASNGFGVG